MVQQLHSIDRAGGPRPLDFILTESDPLFTRENVIFHTSVAPGQIVGQYDVDASPDVTADEGNTGDGTFTLATPATNPGVKAGVYEVEVIGGSYDVTASAVAGSGGGTLTLGTPEFGAGVQVGDYSVICIAGGATATFQVFDPGGSMIGTYTIGGAAFANQVRFSITDGAPDYAAGDTYTLTVEPIVPANGLGAFSVTDPDGVRLDDGVIGTAYDGPIRFTLADGAENFIVGDSFEVEVSVGDNTYGPYDPDAGDGRDEVAGIACYGYDTTDGDVDGVIIARGPVTVKADLVVYHDGASDPEKATARAALAAKNILIR